MVDADSLVHGTRDLLAVTGAIDGPALSPAALENASSLHISPLSSEELIQAMAILPAHLDLHKQSQLVNNLKLDIPRASGVRERIETGADLVRELELTAAVDVGVVVIRMFERADLCLSGVDLDEVVDEPLC